MPFCRRAGVAPKHDAWIKIRVDRSVRGMFRPNLSHVLCLSEMDSIDISTSHLNRCSSCKRSMV